MTDEAVWKIVTAPEQQDVIETVVKSAIGKRFVGIEEYDAAIAWANMEAYDLVPKCHSGNYARH
jgi:hypothetical protein